jgi:hypothetical protein
MYVQGWKQPVYSVINKKLIWTKDKRRTYENWEREFYINQRYLIQLIRL